MLQYWEASNLERIGKDGMTRLRSTIVPSAYCDSMRQYLSLDASHKTAGEHTMHLQYDMNIKKLIIRKNPYIEYTSHFSLH